jgi:hypothetical protein
MKWVRKLFGFYITDLWIYSCLFCFMDIRYNIALSKLKVKYRKKYFYKLHSKETQSILSIFTMLVEATQIISIKLSLIELFSYSRNKVLNMLPCKAIVRLYKLNFAVYIDCTLSIYRLLYCIRISKACLA